MHSSYLMVTYMGPFICWLPSNFQLTQPAEAASPIEHMFIYSEATHCVKSAPDRAKIGIINVTVVSQTFSTMFLYANYCNSVSVTCSLTSCDDCLVTINYLYYSMIQPKSQRSLMMQ